MGAPVLIRAGNLWDGRSDAPSGPMEILVDGERIAAVEESVRCPPGTKIIDLSDRTVTPGFIDCHVHLTLRTGNYGSFWSQSSASRTILGVEALRILLMRGFTTVRDCGDMNVYGTSVKELAHAVEAGMINGPRVVNSGHMISARGGHMDTTSFLAADCHPLESCLADGADEIRRVVREEINRGAEWIKFAGSGGFSSPSDDPSQATYSQEEMDILVGTATDFMRPVSVHAIGAEGIHRAVLAGVRSVEHASMAAKETIGLMEEQGTYVVPTHLVALQYARLNEEGGLPPHVQVKYRRHRDALIGSAESLAKSSVRIAFGTDIGCLPYQVRSAGEFAAMVEYGIAPVRALRAATSTAADLLGRDDIGVLAPGRYADIVAMPGDPFEEIGVTEQVDFVMKGGACCKRGGMSVPQPW